MNSYIKDDWESGKGDPIILTDSCTGESIHEFHGVSTEQADTALQASRDILASWSKTSMKEREKVLRKYGELLGSYQDSIAATISQDTGKPLWEAKTEVAAMQAKIEISINAQEKRCAEFGNGKSFTRFRPHGVVIVLGPFNFPGHVPNGHIVPALLAGNTIIFKPSEMTPRTGNLIVELLLEAGLPEGVIQLLHGGGQIGSYLCNHGEPDAIFFTGSSATGKRISADNAHRPGRIIALEMGGNNPLVVSDIDDVKAAALTIIQSAFMTAGQRCTCARRLILIENEKTDELLDLLVKMSQSIQVGCPQDEPAPFIGPVVSPAAAQNVLSAQQEWIKKGANQLLEAKLIKEGTGLISPGILEVTNVKDRSDDEVFGPLLQVIRVTNMDEAIAEANNTSYGLSAAILSNNKNDYDRFLQEVHAGLINWNQQTTGASSAAPFGGVGDSGNHRPSAYFAADYCNHPVASMESDTLTLPEKMPPGITVG